MLLSRLIRRTNRTFYYIKAVNLYNSIRCRRFYKSYGVDNHLSYSLSYMENVFLEPYMYKLRASSPSYRTKWDLQDGYNRMLFKKTTTSCLVNEEILEKYYIRHQ